MQPQTDKINEIILFHPYCILCCEDISKEGKNHYSYPGKLQVTPLKSCDSHLPTVYIKYLALEGNLIYTYALFFQKK